MGRLYCHHCMRFYYALVISAGFGCPFCRRSLDEYEPHHVLRGRCCSGGCRTHLVVTFEPTSGPVGEPRCPVCFACWSYLKPIERDGILYEPVIRRDREPD